MLPPDFQKLNNLVLFDGSENRLVSVDKVDIRTFTSLTDINLSNNKLKVVEDFSPIELCLFAFAAAV